MKKFLSIFLLIVVLGGAAACGGAPTAAPAPTRPAAAAPAEPPAPEAKSEAAPPAKSEAAPAGSGATRKITDSAGREVTVPADIKKVYTLSPVGTIFMYTLAPDKLAGLSWEPTEGEKKYTTPEFSKLPVLGGTFGQGQQMNPEVVLQANPDIILSLGNVGHTDISQADKIQQQTHIPVILVEMSIATIDKAYIFMGDLLGVQERAKELADYTAQSMAEIQEIARTIPQDKRVRVYYAEDKKGLATDPSGSPHSEVLDLVGGINVADVEITKGYGRTPVNMEQILAWNPEVVIVCFDTGFTAADSPYDFILSDSSWANVQAVKDKKVYSIPYLPFNWFDRPPSVNRIIGARWLANLLYPDYFKYDLRAETRAFYQKFYYRTLSDAELDEILAHAMP